MNDIDVFLERLYNTALSNPNEIIASPQVPSTVRQSIDAVILNAENSKAVLAVTLTSLVYKALHHEQDVRNHQASIPNGYAGRIFDQHYITPFLRSKSFPCMAESGWLTRSLEQKQPYDFNYPGAITPRKLKTEFLNLMHEINENELDIEGCLIYLFAKLIIFRDSKRIDIAKPKNLSINTIIDALVDHFNYPYRSRGASRLPVLAFYAIYQILCAELKRFENKELLSLENHTSADSQSGRVGDVDIVDKDGKPFEAVEIKFNIPIDRSIIERVKEKILPSTISRYYILSTAAINENDREIIQQIITQVKNAHGCQIVVNGIIPSLKYYLRLIDIPSHFIERYAELLCNDENVKYEHKEAWNKIITNI